MIRITEGEFALHSIYHGPFGQVFTTERAWFKCGARLGIVLLVDDRAATNISFGSL